jgi:acetyl esterase/lipase
MKYTKLLSRCFGGLAALFILKSVTLAETVITDFNYWSPGSTPYAYWAPDKSPTITSGADSFNVAADGFGGAYGYLGDARTAPNLSAEDTLQLDVTVNSQANGDKGIGFIVFLEDRDGTVYKYSKFGNRNGNHLLQWNLNEPSTTGNVGTIAGIELSDIKAINILVDSGGVNAYDVSFNQLSGMTIGGAGAAAHTSAGQVSYETRKGLPYIDAAGDARYASCILDIYYPVGVSDFATVVWLHAGGLKQGSRYIPGELMGQGFAVVAVDYSMYPTAKAPEFIEDAAAAVAWTFNNIGPLGGSSDRIFVAGASAGGYLSLMVGLDKFWLSEYDIDANRLAGIIALSGQTITHVAIREAEGGNRTKPVVDAMAPLNHVRADAPPLLLVTGDRELELLGRYEENAYLARMMKVVGHQQTELHELKGLDHPKVEKPGHAFLRDFVKKVSQ